MSLRVNPWVDRRLRLNPIFHTSPIKMTTCPKYSTQTRPLKESFMNRVQHQHPYLFQLHILFITAKSHLDTVEAQSTHAFSCLALNSCVVLPTKFISIL